MNKLQALFRVIMIICKKFYHDNCFMRAGSLAYVTLLSLVPIFTLAFSMFAAFPIFKGLDQKIENLIFNNFVADSAWAIQSYLHGFIVQTTHLSVIGLVFLLITAVEQTFNAIWNVRRNRHGVMAFLMYWAVITLIPIVIATILWLVGHFALLPLFSHLYWLAPYLATFIAFGVLYHALPNCRVPPRATFFAALISTILFELTREAFSIYITNYTTYAVIYGALASIPIFLLWLYVSWVVVLFGAVVSNVLAMLQKQK